MDWRTMYDQLTHNSEQPKYQTIADAIEEAIGQGKLRSGERLPTVRDLSQTLGVSATTIAAAYQLLGQRDYISGVVGRGTFVKGGRVAEPGMNGGVHGSVRTPAVEGWSGSSPWRRRTLAAAASRLRAAYPSALDCTSGQPDTALLPTEIVTHAWRAAVDSITAEQLQYSGPLLLPALARQLLPRLEADGIHANETDIVVGSSAQQWINLGVQVAARLVGQEHPLVAVEEPGYAAMFDSLEYQGYRLIGMESDQHGVLPSSMAQALSQGAAVVLLTPRALNPTGVTWTRERAAELAAVLTSYPGSIVIEDDHFAGLAASNPGSLLGYTAVEDRVIYVRSFSKSIAPDLRLAIAVARSPLRVLLAEAKAFADGWSSHLAQLSLAHMLAQPELDTLLAAARESYAERRAAATKTLSVAKDLATVMPSADGVNLWVRLAPGIEASEVVEQAASLGVLVAPGEPFFVRIGHNDSVRINAGAVNLHGAAKAGEYVAEAIGRAAAVTSNTVVI